MTIFKGFLAVVLVVMLMVSTIGFMFVPSINDLDVKREIKDFSLNTGQIYYLFNHTVININKIIVYLKIGTIFNVSYKIITDYPVETINNSYSYNHTFYFDSIAFFKIISPYDHIEGTIEVDFGSLSSYGLLL